MKKLLYLIIVLVAVCGCKEKAKQKGTDNRSVDVSAFYQGTKHLKPADVIFRCTVKEPNGEKLLLSVNGKDRAYDVPADGKLEIVLEQIIPQYSGITYGVKSFPIYIGGEEPTEFEFSANDDNWKVAFNGGNKDINEYLFRKLQSTGSDFFRYDEKRMIEETEKVLEKNREVLKSCDLPDDFTEIEFKRLPYFMAKDWSSYAFNHRWMAGVEDFEPNEVYYDKMKELAAEDEDLLSVPSYRRFLEKAIPVIVSRGTRKMSPKELASKEAAFVLENYDNPVLRRYLLDYFVTGYISEHGSAGAEDLVAIYKENISDSSRMEEFEGMVGDWSKLAKGAQSPVFTYADAKGDSVSLSSFVGKYVYIDLWASWCGPCRREIPALKELEKQFEGKPIVFVSISCDKDPEAWKKAMEEEKVGGIQLIAGPDLSFLRAYMVQGIPRFILLDREGKIIDPKMTMPTDPKTVETLKMLPGLE